MSDPYFTLLGIPENLRPPTHYQLLGIDPSERDSAAIAAAAARRLQRLSALASAAPAEQIERLTREVEGARDTLCDPAARTRYDSVAPDVSEPWWKPETGVPVDPDGDDSGAGWWREPSNPSAGRGTRPVTTEPAEPEGAISWWKQPPDALRPPPIVTPAPTPEELPPDRPTRAAGPRKGATPAPANRHPVAWVNSLPPDEKVARPPAAPMPLPAMPLPAAIAKARASLRTAPGSPARSAGKPAGGGTAISTKSSVWPWVIVGLLITVGGTVVGFTLLAKNRARHSRAVAEATRAVDSAPIPAPEEKPAPKVEPEAKADAEPTPDRQEAPPPGPATAPAIPADKPASPPATARPGVKKDGSRPKGEDAPESASFHDHTGAVFGVAVSSGGQRAYAIDRDGYVVSYGLARRARSDLHRFAKEGVALSLCAVPAGADPAAGGTLLFCDRREMYVFDLAAKAVKTTLSNPRGEIECLAATADGATVVAGATDGCARVWDVAAKQLTHTIDLVDTGPVTAVAVEGRRAAFGLADGRVRLWDLAGPAEVRQWKAHTARVTVVAFEPDSERLLSAGDDSTAAVWQPAEAKLVRRFDGHTAPVLAAAWAGPARVVSCDTGGTIRLWGAAGDHVDDWRPTLAAPAFSLAADPAGRMVATGESDGSLQVFPLPPPVRLAVPKAP